jgi:hypothetical protein
MTNNEPKNIAIVCLSDDEKALIEKRLKDEAIAFGSSIEQDSDRTLIAVDTAESVISREWPFVTVISLLPFQYSEFSIMAASRAIAHLTYIERDERQIRKSIRESHNFASKKNFILSSFTEYEKFRSEMQLSDVPFILFDDLFVDIIANNYFPTKIKQLFPIFADCETFDDFIERIVNKQQWMFLLFVQHWDYFQYMRHANESIELIFEYRESKNLIEICNKDKMRLQRLNIVARSAIDLLNKYNRLEIKDNMEIIIKRNFDLFQIFNKSNGKEQFDLIAYTIRHFAIINAVPTLSPQDMRLLDRNSVVKSIDKLIEHLILLAKKPTRRMLSTTTSFSRVRSVN